MKTSLRTTAALAVTIASLFATGCSANSDAPEGSSEDLDDNSNAVSSNTVVGDWSRLGNGQCLVSMQNFYPAMFGVYIPSAPSTWSGDCAPEGACHLGIDTQPNPEQWERVDWEVPSTYDLVIYGPTPTNPYGHIAAVDHVENGQIFVMDSNFNSDEQRSWAPHTVSRAPIAIFHLRSLPKNNGGMSGGTDGDTGGSGGSASCAGYGNGLYCGGNYVSGDPNTLYSCTNGVLTPYSTCEYGCQWMPDGYDDKCY